MGMVQAVADYLHQIKLRLGVVSGLEYRRCLLHMLRFGLQCVEKGLLEHIMPRLSELEGIEFITGCFN
jgi:hypothetical protein